MIRKLLIFFIISILLCSCQNSNISVEETETQPSVSSDNVENKKADVSSNNVDDFAFYNINGELIVSLLSREDDIDYETDDIVKAISGFDIINFNQNNPDDIYVDWLYFSKGFNQVVQTGKGIRTAGNSSGKYDVSTENEIIKAYNINKAEEEIYSSNNSVFRTLTVYFQINSDGTVQRIIFPKGSDISNFNSIDNANAYISFEIDNNTNIVKGILMKYKSKKVTQN